MSWRRRRSTEDDTEALTGAEQGDAETTTAVEAPAAEPAEDADPRPDRSRGPFDVTEVDDEVPRVDLGALHVPAVAGMELRLEVEDATQRVVAATVGLAGSTVQLQAFAAPRTTGIWRDIRREIAASVTAQGGTANEVAGSLGPELVAFLPAQLPDGRMAQRPARFIGVDGPRWFLRAVYSGPAAVDTAAAGPLEEVVRACVVLRGTEAMAPRDLLELRLPPQAPEAGEEPVLDRPGE